MKNQREIKKKDPEFYRKLLALLIPMVVQNLMNLDEMIKLPAVYRHYKKYQWVNNITREDTE